MTAEKYISDGQYAEFYEIPPFAYDFALKLSLAFNQQDLATRTFSSLHRSILIILDSGEKRWQLELFKVESKYLDRLSDTDDIRKESIERLESIIEYIGIPAKGREKYQDEHFLRAYLELLLSYVPNDQKYEIQRNIAESYVHEADGKVESVKSAFYLDAAKAYKKMQGSFPNYKEEIKKRIEELTHLINASSQKIVYREVAIPLEIKRTWILDYVSQLKHGEGNIYSALVSDGSLFPSYDEILKETLEQKAKNPLTFILPVVINRIDEPVMRYSTEDKIFEYRLMRNIRLRVKIGEIMLRMTLEEIEKQYGQRPNEYISTLLTSEDVVDIAPTLRCGFDYIFSDSPDYIAGFHVLMPYFEEILRRIIKKSGRTDAILHTHHEAYFRKIELGTLLDDKNVSSLIGKDFQVSLKVLLTDNAQTNLRNELLHGLVKSKAITESETRFVAYCLLKLIQTLVELGGPGAE